MSFENFSFSTYVPGKPDDRPRRIKAAPSNLTRAKLRGWIEKAGIEEDVKVELLKKLDSFPANTMSYFYENIHTLIHKIQMKRADKQKRNNDT